MCGNFGLLLLQKGDQNNERKRSNTSILSRELVLDELDQSLNRSRSVHFKPNSNDSVHLARQISIESMRKVSELNRIRLNDSVHSEVNRQNDLKLFDGDESNRQMDVKALDLRPILPLIQIIEAQASSTEIRGGQAGGVSCLEYTQNEATKFYDGKVGEGAQSFKPLMTRVRCLGRRRGALASTLADSFRKSCTSQPSASSTVTILGHTRFATGSFNTVPELHPHEWVPFHEERVWSFRTRSMKHSTVGIHISHNGDFDALNIYGHKVVNGDVGLWLERVLHTPNTTRGDSPKIAGCLDLFLVQGRWGAAARLAYLRCRLSAPTDVSGKNPLSKSALNTFPSPAVWEAFSVFFQEIWFLHISNVTKPSMAAPDLTFGGKYYTIDVKGEAQLRSHLLTSLTEGNLQLNSDVIDLKAWSVNERQSFIFHTVRGFLRYDLYSATTEFLSRAEGSFGLQMHCTLEPGVVVIASKGQPMSVAFDPTCPLCLFGSEAQALAVPVDESGRWLPQRVDLDSRGEIMRIGIARSLIEGTFDEGTHSPLTREWHGTSKRLSKQTPGSITALVLGSTDHCLLLDCGVELRTYSLQSSRECRRVELMDRVIDVLTAPVPYSPLTDLVASDLSITPATLSRIDEAWSDVSTHEYGAAEELCLQLIRAMAARQSVNKDSIDLLVAGVEASLWIAEQWAADLRSLFPYLNVVTQSTNKLMGLEGDAPGKIFFSGSETTSWRRIDSSTCVLLISQSGQTFPTLHATREMARLVQDRLWILTGCFHSKMEQVLREAYDDSLREYCNDRVFNNYSGNCPAEPTSVAAAATHHSLSRLMLHLIEKTAKYLQYGPEAIAHHTTHTLPVSRPFTTRECRPGAVGKSALDGSVNLDVALHVVTEGGGVGGPHELFDLGNNMTMNKKPFGQGDTLHPNGQDAGCVRMTTADALGVSGKLMTLSPSCVDDVRTLLTRAVIPGLESIVGVDMHMKPIVSDACGHTHGSGSDVHTRLVNQGLLWARHVQEPWEVLVLVGAYLVVSVGLGLPIVGILATIVQEIIKSATAGNYGGDGVLAFSPRSVDIMRSQPAVYTILGLLIQLVDAVIYVYLAKIFTWGQRWLEGRPLWARHGRRTLVVVDSPMVHQLTENFVSKLFSLSYGFCGLEVHGANGLDHFVHRFTHRVCRGLLLAVGRPDGRLCCLAKSESAVILATKQAAFIQNPEYTGVGSGPDIVSVGHNSFSPTVGLVTHIVIPGTRGAFLDEIVYEQLSRHPKASEAALELLRRLFNRIHKKKSAVLGKLYGTQLIENFVTESILNRFMRKELTSAWGKLHDGDIKRPAESYDPAEIFAFTARLDGGVQTLLQLQRPLQQLYEGRVAALERYLSFCVMFHAMARRCSSPWLRPPWDVSRSQSNLRVATTACPVAVVDGKEGNWSPAVQKITKQFAEKLRGFSVNM